MELKIAGLFMIAVMLSGTIACSGYLNNDGSNGSSSSSSTPDSLFVTTTNYNNFHNGVMFNITALRAITVRNFSIIPSTVYGSNVTVEVWYRPGGLYTNSSGWVFAGSATVDMITNVLTYVPLNISVSISNGGTTGFYITRTDGSIIRYQNSLGTAFTNSDLSVNPSGYGIPYPLGTGAVSSRSFCGGIYYRLD
jgi:hypothetical protein